MTSSYPRSPAAASPWGLVLSVCLHGLMFLVVISLSFSLSKVNKPAEESISRVKLVAPQAYSPVVEQIQHGPAEASNFLPEVRTQSQLPEKVSEKPRATVEARVVASQNRDVVAIKKRKKPLRRVEAAKEPDKKKPQPEPAKNKQDPQSFLEKRLAAIRQDVESKKTAASPPRPSQDGSQTPGRPEGKQGGPSVDEESAQWFDGVKTLINSHWSILGDNRQVARVTIIGVKIADNGRLVDASVDESSGDQVFDRSAMRAVFQASPFPPVPSELKEKISKAGGLALRFTPKGMQ
ncbi:MAG: TonB family protein [Desulfomonilaceae bacterium]